MVDYVEKWGRKTARERYGMPKAGFGPPKEDMSAPQKAGDPNNLRAPTYDNETSGWVRGAGESGKPPNFDKG